MMAPPWLQRACAATIAWRIRATHRPRRRLPLGIFKADRVGDLVLAQGAIARLVRSVPAGGATLITSDVAAHAATELFPDLPRITVTQRGIVRGLPLVWKSADALLGLRFERLVCLQHHRSATQDLLLRAIEADWSAGCENARPDHGAIEACAGGRAFDATSPYPDYAGDLPRELEAHRRVVAAACGSEIPPSEILPHVDAAGTTARHLLLCPFASDPIREYPAELLASALRAAQSGAEMPIRIAGSPAEQERARALAARLAASGVRDVALAPTPSFRDYAAAVASAKLILTMESGGAHLATAMGKDTVVLLGGGHFGLLAPWSRSPRQTWLSNPLPCYGCDWKCTRPAVECITGVRPDDVARALRSLWNDPA